MRYLSKDNYHWWMPFTQMNTFLKKHPVIIDQAEGVYLTDTNGRKYLDMSSSMWNVCLGHKRKEIIEAIYNQYHRLDFSSPFRASNSKAVELAKKLSEINHSQLKKSFFTCNGSDSVEAGIKMARQYFKLKNQKKYKIISLKKAYHGVSYGAMAASGFEEDKVYFEPLPAGFLQIPPPYCYRCPYNKTYPSCNIECANYLEEVIKKEKPETVAMFLIEPVMGMGGVIIPPKEYFKIINKICKKYNILLMVDEVTTGFGRTGKMFAHEYWNLSPDIMCLGKGISNGSFPIGATMVTDKIWEQFLNGDEKTFNHGSTYFGHPVGCAAALTCIDIIIKENIIENVQEKGKYFSKLLNDLKGIRIVGDIRSIGLMFAIEFVNDKEYKQPLNKALISKIIGSCHMLGIWAHFTENVMLLFPPFICSNEHLQKAFHILNRVINSVSKK